MTERGAFSEFSRTQNLAIDAAQDHALYEQPLGISAQLGDPSVHRIVMRSVERALARRAQQRPSRIGIDHVAMDAFVPYIHAVDEALPEAARKIVFDKLHITRNPRDAVNAVRVAERRAPDAMQRHDALGEALAVVLRALVAHIT